MHEVEPPIEAVAEHIHHAAEHGGETWISGVALSTAVFAAIAAVAIMLSGHYANDAMIEQIQASDKWAYYQAKGIKKNVDSAAIKILKKLDKEVDPKDEVKVARYEKEQESIKEIADELEGESYIHFQRHIVTTYSIALLQVTITIAAVAALTRKKSVWLISLLIGVAGVALFVYALEFTPPARHKEEGEGKPVAAEKHGGEKHAGAEKETPATKEPAGENAK